MVSTEFLPRFSIIDGAISAYDVDKRGVVANGSEYLFGVLSVGVVPFALAALVLCYVVVVNLVLRPLALAVGIGRRSGGGEDPAEEREMGMAAAGRGRGGGGILRALSSRSRRRREARLVLPGERDERDNSCISSRCFVDTTKVLVLFFALTSLVCCLVLVLYGAEMQSLSERGTDSFEETLKNEGARLNVARRAAQYTGEAGAAQRAAVLWEHFVKRVVPVVTKNHSVLDDSYFGAIVLVYFVPAAAALIGFASVGFAFRVCRCSEESSPSPLVPWLFVLCACCFGLALGAPALFSDVCGQASEYLASPRLNTRLNAKFASSVYPCASLGMRTAGSWDATAEELGSALASLGFSSDLRAYAVSKTRQLNQDLRAYRTGLGLSEQQVPPLCEPYSALDPENATALRDAGMGLGVVEAAWLVGTEGGNRHGGRTLEWGATPPISVLFSPDEAAQLPDLKKAVEGGNLPYPSLLWVPNRCSRTRANLLENFSKSSSGGGYAGQASAMVQRGLSFEAMEDAAAMAAEAALASDDVVSRANCGFTREALQGMRNYSHGDRCDRLDFVSTVFWIGENTAPTKLLPVTPPKIDRTLTRYFDPPSLPARPSERVPRPALLPPGSGSGDPGGGLRLRPGRGPQEEDAGVRLGRGPGG